MNNWYLYRHVRLDKNEPFYIGIGCTRNYKRAYEARCRSEFWKRVVTSTAYDVEILMDGLTKEQAIEKEKEFILLYGRRDLRTGTLVNMTHGGDGRSAYTTSDEVKAKIRKSLIGKKQSPEHTANATAAMLGKKRSVEARLNMRLVKLGRKQSPEHIANNKAAQKRRRDNAII